MKNSFFKILSLLLAIALAYFLYNTYTTDEIVEDTKTTEAPNIPNESQKTPTSLNSDVFNSMEEEIEIKEVSSENERQNFNFCTSTQAIVANSVNDIIYDTNEGTARYKIPIPRGSKLLMAKVNGNKVMYVFSGSKYSNDIVHSWRKVRGLSKKEKDTLTVEVLFAFYEQDECSGDVNTRTEKKKTTTVEGVPFIGSKK